MKLTSSKILDIVLPKIQTQEMIDHIYDIFDYNKDDLNIEKEWKNKKIWKRYHKVKTLLGKTRHIIYDYSNYNKESIDMIGEISDLAITDNCTYRLFYIDEEKYFGDSFRLEIFTDEKDEQIIYWNLCVD